MCITIIHRDAQLFKLKSLILLLYHHLFSFSITSLSDKLLNPAFSLMTYPFNAVSNRYFFSILSSRPYALSPIPVNYVRSNNNQIQRMPAQRRLRIVGVRQKTHAWMERTPPCEYCAKPPRKGWYSMALKCSLRTNAENVDRRA